MTDLTPLAEATAAQLREHAERMGLETKSGHNSKQLIALIKRANPDVTEIPTGEAVTPPAPDAPVLDPAASAAAPPVVPPPTLMAVEAGGNKMMPHYSRDPKVELVVQKTNESTRSKDVTVAVNGDVFRLQRGQNVEVPYRVYLALQDAVEKQSVETGEERNGVPVREWQEVQSYPFIARSMPSDEEIAAWHRATDEAFASASRARAA